ncbi:MAG TPA: arginine repressor [Candidatus Gallimonas gallistercoris]|uniref:Arginine repressor n=1 Tax=Candidatus Gallimonas gallistercoris TaxID=2838602 RepID=A0A9D2H1Y2_9FIRM|nr:arginine repressor [Candidatus Gallimonas gallistercoris]
MLRNARHNKILELIEEKEIETQEELCKELAEANFAVTQATVSRDVRELRLFKVAGTKKRYRYAAIGKGEEELSDKMRSLFQACIESIQTVGNIVVTKTLNGNGANAGVIIDMLKYQEIVGSIAGDDTVFSLCKTAEDAETVRGRLERLAGN